MSFVKKGEKKMHNMSKGAGKGADRPAVKDGFGKKGMKPMKNEAPESMDKEMTPVSSDEMSGKSFSDGPTTKASEYDPASGKKAKSVADLRAAAKKINERSSAGEASPTGSQGGQDAENDSDENETGYMKAGDGPLDKKSKRAPRGLADVDGDDDMEDGLDEGQEGSGQTEEGMTPSGKSRKKAKSLKDVKAAAKKLMYGS
jgi:hypothetical protein